MENQSAQQSFQPNEDGRSPEIQTGVAEPANGDDYWYPLLEKTRQEAFQRLERYPVSQQGHIQTYESDPLGNYFYFAPSILSKIAYEQQFRIYRHAGRRADYLLRLSKRCGQACKISRICSHECGHVLLIHLELPCSLVSCRYYLCNLS
jgi:hypothetical protein